MIGRVPALCAILLLAPGAAVAAGPDTLPAERLAFIRAAFDTALSAPSADVDRLSPDRMRAIRAAFDSHRSRPDVDRLPAARLAAIRDAYRSHDRVQDIVALAR